jgi:hypothetical protein
MTLGDPRFAAELVSRTGLVTPFDDVGCLASHVADADSAAIHSIWASDYLEPDSIVAVERLVFLKTDSVRTPMSYGIVAVRPGPRADSLAVALGANRWTWLETVAWVRDNRR